MYLRDFETSITFVRSATLGPKSTTIWTETAQHLSCSHEAEITKIKFKGTVRITSNVTGVMYTTIFNSESTGQQKTETHTLGMVEARTEEEMDQTTSSRMETWQVTVERVQFVMTLFGYIANIVTLVTLVRNGQLFSKPYCLLLKHQSLVDSGVCLMAATLLMQPPLWTTGIVRFEAIVV